MRHILIIGGSGFVGRSLIQLSTASESYDITLATRRPVDLLFNKLSISELSYFTWDVRHATDAELNFVLDIFKYAKTKITNVAWSR